MSPHPYYGYFGQVANIVGNNDTEKRGRDHRRFIDCSFTGNNNRIVNDNDSNSNSNRKRSSSSSSSSSSSKLHRLLIRSTSSLGCDDENGIGNDNDNDRKINTKESRHNKLTLLRKKFSPFANHHHHHHHRTTSDPSSGNLMMNYSSSSSSSLPPPPSIVNTTILTTTSTMKATTTPCTVAMSSSASFFSYSDDDDDDDDYDDYCEEAKNGNTDYNDDVFDDEDEESNHTLSVRSPLITKLLRDELKRRDNDVVDHQDRDCDDDNKRNNFGYYSTNTSLHIWKFTLYWSVGAFIWILVFSMPTNKYKDDVEGADDLELDRIRYTSLSIFWTRILKCLFMICTSGFVGSALGQCGNAVIEAYNTAISSYSNNDDACSHGQNHSRRTTGDMSIDDEETGKAYHNDNDGNVHVVKDDYLVLFPYLSWLLMQSLFLTVLSIATVAAVASTLTSTIGVNNNNDEYKGNNGDFVSTLYYAVFTATTAGLDGDVIISTRGKVLALLFIPLSMTTTLHWIVYIAQRYIQRTQRRKYKQQKQRRQQQERKQDAVANKHYYFDTTKIIRANSKIVVATDTNHHYRQNRAMKDDDKAPVVAAINNPRENGSSLFSIEDFYEVELQRMGLVDIETFRVLKRKYAMRQRRQQKMLDTT